MIRESIHDRACGRWPSILRAIGIDSRYLSKKPGPCPLCGGGTDRWSFDDKDGRGTWICRKCPADRGKVAFGNGVDLVMRFKSRHAAGRRQARPDGCSVGQSATARR
jgi:putative DNA primase/helicase